MRKRLQRAAAGRLTALALLAAACTAPQPGEITVSVNGSVSSLVTTVPPRTTTTAAEQRTTTSLPGSEPGACAAPGETLIVALVENVAEAAPCAVSTTGRIRFSNLTDDEVTVEWGNEELRIAAQRSILPPETVGEVLSPGLHAFVTSLDSVPTVLIAAPEEGFGSAVVGLRSFGGVRPGQRLSEAEEALALPIAVVARGESCTLGWIAGDPHSPLLSIDTTDEDPLILRAAATSANQLTLSNVGIGTPETVVREVYGSRLTAGPNPDPASPMLVFEPNESVDANYRLIFDLGTVDGESVVTAMRIGRLGDVERSTPCP